MNRLYAYILCIVLIIEKNVHRNKNKQFYIHQIYKPYQKKNKNIFVLNFLHIK